MAFVKNGEPHGEIKFKRISFWNEPLAQEANPVAMGELIDKLPKLIQMLDLGSCNFYPQLKNFNIRNFSRSHLISSMWAT